MVLNYRNYLALTLGMKGRCRVLPNFSTLKLVLRHPDGGWDFVQKNMLGIKAQRKSREAGRRINN